MPCASGRSLDQLIVSVWRRMYCFQESLPDSRPPPVSFSPPNAPPISAPLVPMLTLAMPQSLPRCAEERLRADHVGGEDGRREALRDVVLPLRWPLRASSNSITYRIGAKISSRTMGMSARARTMAGSDIAAARQSSFSPPYRISPPCSRMSSSPSHHASTARRADQRAHRACRARADCRCVTCL